MWRRKTLYELWVSRRRNIHIKAEIARAGARILLVALPIWGFLELNLFQLVNSEGMYAPGEIPMGSPLFIILGSIFLCGSLVCASEVNDEFYRRLYFFNTLPSKWKQHPQIIPLERDIAPDLRFYCTWMATRLGLDREKWRYFCDTENITESASILESPHSINLLFASGFFKLWEENLPAAQAILAHEFGHVAQRDTAAWIYVDCFLKKCLRPATIAHLTFGCICLVIYIYSHRHLLRGDRASDTYDALYFFYFLTIIPTLMGFTFYYLFVQAGRRQSEKLADLAALLLTSPEGLRLALLTPTQRQDPLSIGLVTLPNFFSIHPTRLHRLRHLQRLSRLTPGLPPEGVPLILPPPAPRKRVVALLPLRWGCYLLIGSALMAVCYQFCTPLVEREGQAQFDWAYFWLKLSYIALAMGSLAIFAAFISSSVARIRRGILLVVAGAAFIGIGGIVSNNLTLSDSYLIWSFFLGTTGLCLGISSIGIGYFGGEVEAGGRSSAPHKQ